MPFDWGGTSGGGGYGFGSQNKMTNAYSGQDWQQNRRQSWMPNNVWTQGGGFGYGGGGGGGGGYGGYGSYGGGYGGGGGGGGGGQGYQGAWQYGEGTGRPRNVWEGSAGYEPGYQERQRKLDERTAYNRAVRAERAQNPYWKGEMPQYNALGASMGDPYWASKSRAQNVWYEQSGGWGGLQQRMKELTGMKQYLTQLAAGGPGQKYIDSAMKHYISGNPEQFQQYINWIFNPPAI